MDAVRCCQYGELDKLRGLLEANRVDCRAVDKDGCTLLHWAAINGHQPIVEYLLRKGADPCATGGILLELPLQWAARENRLGALVSLLAAGSNVSHKNFQGNDVLHIATQMGHTLTVLYLLAYGVPPDTRNAQDLTALAWCCCHAPHNVQLLSVIARFSGADVINYQDGYVRNTALHWAVASGCSADVAQMLLERGADTALLNSDGNTALQTARLWHNEEAEMAIREFQRRHVDTFMSCALPPMALAFCVSAVAVLGWVYGVPTFLLVLCCLLMAHGEPRRRRLDFLGLSTVCTCGVAVELGHLFLTAHVCNVLENAVQFALLSIAVGLYYRARTSDPGTICADEEELRALVLDVAAKGDLQALDKVCMRCLAPMVEGTVHCDACGCCVHRYDHHSHFLGTCVARNNKLTYVSLLLSTALLLGWNAVMQVKYATALCRSPNLWEVGTCVTTRHRPFAFIVVLGVAAFCAIVGAIANQLWSVGCRQEGEAKAASALQRVRRCLTKVVRFFNEDEETREASGEDAV